MKLSDSKACTELQKRGFHGAVLLAEVDNLNIASSELSAQGSNTMTIAEAVKAGHAGKNIIAIVRGNASLLFSYGKMLYSAVDVQNNKNVTDADMVLMF